MAAVSVETGGEDGGTGGQLLVLYVHELGNGHILDVILGGTWKENRVLVVGKNFSVGRRGIAGWPTTNADSWITHLGSAVTCRKLP